MQCWNASARLTEAPAPHPLDSQAFPVSVPLTADRRSRRPCGGRRRRDPLTAAIAIDRAAAANIATNALFRFCGRVLTIAAGTKAPQST